jgi:hypothetical protein
MAAMMVVAPVGRWLGLAWAVVLAAFEGPRWNALRLRTRDCCEDGI